MIEVDGLAKDYDGAPALREVTFTVPSGGIFAFIGPNGAGKTTTLKILGAMLKPAAGRVRVMGADVVRAPAEVRRLVGWMPDQYGVYADLRVWEYLDFFASGYRVPPPKRREAVERVLALTGLGDRSSAMVGNLSRGMTQKLCLGRALLHDPPVLLLDEPASGLDPQARMEFRDLVKLLQRSGKTILVSSHILPELVEYCNGVAIIHAGVVKFSGPMEELESLLEAPARRVRVRLLEAGDAPRALEALRRHPGFRRAEPVERGVEAELAGDERAVADALQLLADERLPVVGFQELKLDLGDIFLRMVKDER